MLLVHVSCSLAFVILQQKNIVLPIEARLIVSELTILVPALIYVLIRKLSFSRDLGFRRIKAGTVLMSVLIAVLSGTIAIFFNVVSQLFVSNTIVEMSDSLLAGSNAAVWFLGSVYGPFCEEFVFRSLFNSRYEIVTGSLRAGLVSALFFALTHMNINQAAYAFVLGVIFSVIDKAAGSVYPSMIIHTCINGFNLLVIIALLGISDSSEYTQDLAVASEAARQGDLIYVMTGVTLVGAIISTLILIPCVAFVAKHEGRYDELLDMFRNRRLKGRWLTVSSALAICFVLFVMFGMNAMLSAIGF